MMHRESLKGSFSHNYKVESLSIMSLAHILTEHGDPMTRFS